MAVLKHKELEIHFDEEGEGPTVLFMHGLAADRERARKILGAQTGIRLITIDMPGHGETELSASEPLDQQIGFCRYAEIALALLDQLGVRKVIAGGISMGSGIALTMGLMRPGLLAGLFMARPAWLAAPARPHLELVATLGELSKNCAPEAVVAKISASESFKQELANIPAAANSLLHAAFRPQARDAAAVLSQMVDDQPFSRLAELSRLRCPALVLGSNADPLHPTMLARELAAALPKGRYKQLPPRYLDPAAHGVALNSSFRSFLEQLSINATKKEVQP